MAETLNYILIMDNKYFFRTPLKQVQDDMVQDDMVQDDMVQDDMVQDDMVQDDMVQDENLDLIATYYIKKD